MGAPSDAAARPDLVLLPGDGRLRDVGAVRHQGLVGRRAGCAGLHWLVRRRTGRYRRGTRLPLGLRKQQGQEGSARGTSVTRRGPTSTCVRRSTRPCSPRRARHPVGHAIRPDSPRMVLALEPNILPGRAGVAAPEAECRVPCLSAAGGRGGNDISGQHVLRTDDGALDTSGVDQCVRGSRSLPLQR